MINRIKCPNCHEIFIQNVNSTKLLLECAIEFAGKDSELISSIKQLIESVEDDQ